MKLDMPEPTSWSNYYIKLHIDVQNCFLALHLYHHFTFPFNNHLLMMFATIMMPQLQ